LPSCVWLTVPYHLRDRHGMLSVILGLSGPL
jgi:hypothetical protein